MENVVMNFIQSLLTCDIGGATIIGVAFGLAIEKTASMSWVALKKWYKSNSTIGANYATDLCSAIEASVQPFAAAGPKHKQMLINEASVLVLRAWHADHGLTPSAIRRAIAHVSPKGCSDEDIALWYEYFFEQISKTKIYEVFTLYQLSEMQRVDRETNELLKNLHRHMIKKSETSESEISFPTYISEHPLDIIDGFVGRHVLISDILDCINSRRSVLLSGIGGLGKTEVAKAVLKVIENTPSTTSGIDYILWVNYDNQDIRLSITKSLFHSRQIDNIEDAWQKALAIISNYREKLLLIIDNIESHYDDRNLFRIADLPCRVFATGRVTELSSLHIINLAELPMEDCVTLFLHYYTRKDISLPILKKIITLSDRHTITVELLSKVAELEELSLDIFHEKLVKLGFRLSTEEVAAGHERLDKEAHIIKQLSILFSVSRIPLQLTPLLMMISVIPSLPFTFQNAQTWFGLNNRKDIIRLVHTGWIIQKKNREHSLFIMHSVIAAAVREQFKSELYNNCRGFILALTTELKYDKDDHGLEKVGLIQFSWSVNDLLCDHLETERDADFLYFLARIYIDIANYDQALLLLKRSIRIYRKSEENSIHKLCASYNSIGLVYQEMCFFKHSITQYKKLLSLIQNHDLEVGLAATAYNNAGLTYYKLSDKKAYGYFAKAYELAKDAFGVDNTETLKIYFNLGNGKAELGDSEGALNIYISVLCKEKTIFGTDHLRVATSRNSIGNFLYDLGRFDEAEKHLERALAVRKTKLGIEHPATTDTLNTLGLIYLRKEKHSDARDCFEAVRDFNIKTYGEIHPEVAVSYNNLGLVAFYEDDFESALPLYEKARAIHQEFGWDSREDAVGVINNIGYVYNETGNPKKALEYFEESLCIINKKPDGMLDELAHTYNDIAVAHCALGTLEKAKYYFQESIKHSIMSWGDNHISLAPTYNNYALLLKAEGNLKNALEYLRESRRLVVEYLGDNNPNLEIIDKHIAEIEK